MLLFVFKETIIYENKDITEHEVIPMSVFGGDLVICHLIFFIRKFSERNNTNATK